MADTSNNYSSGYGKRPLWQWIVLYLIIGAIVYGLVYYFFLAKKGGYTARPSAQQTTPVSNVSGDNIYLTKTDSAKGSYMADFGGMTLYRYDKDTSGVSNCTGSCASTWRPYTSGAAAQATLPANITVIKRTDGSNQFAWKGMPLYYFASDTQPGQITGDGVEDFHLAK